ncbi:MAG: hypothetical protein LBB26_02910 [Puniceicoccales bacterium]|jgi:hypothetical protein|nr:hypothetical protein [Puniceicoccales bacterium]
MNSYFYKNSTFKFLTFPDPYPSIPFLYAIKDMKGTTILPRKFGELAAASVYFQALDMDTSRLRPVYEESSFDTDPDGTIHYYKVTIDGSYVRATYGMGDFVKATRPDGSEIFFHYSQVFQPTRAAHQQLGITAQVLAIAYQNANRQMATLSEFIREAEMVNARIERFRSFFNDLSAMASGCDLAAPHMVLPFVQEQLTTLESLGITSPVGTLATRGLPQLYARVVRPDLWWDGYKWEFFFIDVDADGRSFENVVHEDRVCYGRFEKPKDPPDYDLEAYSGDMEAMGKTFDGDAWNKAVESSHALKTQHEKRWLVGGFIPAAYYRCVFKDDGKITYEHVCGGQDNGTVDKVYELFQNEVGECQKSVRPYFVGTARKTLENIRETGEGGYITGVETQEVLGAVQAGIDYSSNRLQGIVTQVAAMNNEMEQGFAIATAIIEASGESRRRGLSNMR